jgi:hypothetical protein
VGAMTDEQRTAREAYLRASHDLHYAQQAYVKVQHDLRDAFAYKLTRPEHDLEPFHEARRKAKLVVSAAEVEVNRAFLVATRAFGLSA